MNKSTNSIYKSLKYGKRNAGRAIVKDGIIFINDIIIMPQNDNYDVSLTVCGIQVDLSQDKQALAQTHDVVRRVHRIQSNRQRVRDFIQYVSDKITRNNHLEDMSTDDIMAWFTLKDMRRRLNCLSGVIMVDDPDTAENTAQKGNRIVITRVGYMHKIRYGNISLGHIPADDGERIFFLEIGDKVISIREANKCVYSMAEMLFFDVYSRYILPHMAMNARRRRQKSL